MSHVQQLDRQLDDLEGSLAQLGRHDFIETLRKLSHGPGWTSPAEAHLVSGAVEALQLHARALSTQSRQLVSAAEKVGNGQCVEGCAQPLLAGGPPRFLALMLEASAGGGAAVFKKALGELLSSSLVDEPEAKQLTTMSNIAFSNEISSDTPMRVRRACQEIMRLNSTSHAASIADAISNAMLGIDDGLHRFTVEEKIPPKVYEGAAIGAIIGGVVGAIAGATTGTPTGVAAGAAAGAALGAVVGGAIASAG